DVEIAQDEHQRSLKRLATMTMPTTAPANTPAMPSGTAAPTAAPTPNPIRAPSTIAARSRLPATAPRRVGLLGGSVIGVAVGGLRFWHEGSAANVASAQHPAYAAGAGFCSREAKGTHLPAAARRLADSTSL